MPRSQCLPVAAAFAAAAALLALAGCAALPIEERFAAPTTTLSDSAIRKSLLLIASGNGDNTPSEITYVVSTEGRASPFAFGGDYEPMSDDASAENDPVVLVEARGAFANTMAKIPAGATAPMGSVITVILREDGTISDWGLSDSYLDLADLGDVTSLK